MNGADAGKSKVLQEKITCTTVILCCCGALLWDDWFDEEVDKAYEELYFLRRCGEADKDE
ncbi:MAG: hypothetical protein AB1426_12685 [Bacillota bacterium]